MTAGLLACACARTSIPLVTTTTLKPARCRSRDIRKCWSSSSSAIRTVWRASAGIAGTGALAATVLRSSVKAPQISPSRRLADGGVEAGAGFRGGDGLERRSVLREAEELGRAGPADQAVGRVAQVDQRIRVAAAGRLDQHREQLEAARKAGDEAPASFVDDFLYLSRRKRGGLPPEAVGPSG